MTDLINMRFKAKRRWPFTSKTIKADRVIRSAFVDPHTEVEVVAFECDLFTLHCVFGQNDRMHIRCVSDKYRLDLIEKLVNFSVFAELQSLESHQPCPENHLKTKKFVVEKF